MFNKKEYDKKYYIENKERLIGKSRKYYIDNRKIISEKAKKYREDNPELFRIWAKNNPEKVKERRKEFYLRNEEKELERQRVYRKNNKEKIKIARRKYSNQRRKMDLRYNLNWKMANVIGRVLKGKKNYRCWEILVGYALKDLIKRLKSTMPKGYTWQDFLQGKLHIDHKIPISAFNYTKSGHTDFKRCWALSNLQLLPAKENLIKGSKLNRPFQPALQI